jgi:hypothetical protein
MFFPRGLVVILWFDVISWLAPNLERWSEGLEVSPAWDKTRGGRARHNQERKENEAESKGA